MRIQRLMVRGRTAGGPAAVRVAGTGVRQRGRWLSALACLMAAGVPGTVLAAECADLATPSRSDLEVRSAELLGAGEFQVDGTGRGAAALNVTLARLPAFCRVEATARPTADSDIGIELWLPAAGWNGRLQVVGNGGWAGSISTAALAGALEAGYATASTDTGHRGGSVDFAIGHPEKLVDFAHRAVHETAVMAKAFVAEFYGRAEERAYFAGCSTGGRQALTAAQRYPGDFDGIVAGAAAYYPTHLQGTQVWTAAVAAREANAALGQAEFELVNAAVLASCDAADGVVDGVLERPAECRFDPAQLVCEAGNSAAQCLSAAQAETVRQTWAGPRTAAGESIFPGLARGSELGWSTLSGAAPLGLADDTYRVLVFADPDWDFRTIDPERDFALGVERIGALMNANDADLEPFFSRGGKLLIYHGWNDPGITPFASVRYYEDVRTAVGAEMADASVRLFMVPGMNHCRGGAGPDTFDAVGALDTWLDSGIAPQRIEAQKLDNGAAVRSRPLCPYPLSAVYTGEGSTDDTANFECR